MKLNKLKPAKGSVKNGKRIARGQGSGKGGTAARGHKGAKSRSGYSSKRNFEGGQMPLQMRLPKRGFKNTHRRYKTSNPSSYLPFNLNQLAYFAEKHNLTELTLSSLVKIGAVSKNDAVKVLANGELKKALEVSAHTFSKSAKAAITAAGGKAFVVLNADQIQGVVHKYNLESVDAATLVEHFSTVNEGDLVHVVAGGDLSIKFNLSAHKVDEDVKAAITAAGGSVSIL